jgi:bacterioferritin-associated ferredoxin
MGDQRANKPKDPRDEIVCLCNEVARGTIEDAIKMGCDTLNKIYDRTTAGVGPCGGSCRKFLGPMLDHYLKSGEFPAGPIRPKPQKKSRRA